MSSATGCGIAGLPRFATPRNRLLMSEPEPRLHPLILQERRYSGHGSTHPSCQEQTRAPAKLRHSSTSCARLSSMAAFVSIFTFLFPRCRSREALLKSSRERRMHR